MVANVIRISNTAAIMLVGGLRDGVAAVSLDAERLTDARQPIAAQRADGERGGRVRETAPRLFPGRWRSGVPPSIECEGGTDRCGVPVRMSGRWRSLRART